MDKVLVVEDSRLVCKLLQETIQERVGVQVETAHDFAAARTILEERAAEFFLALLDLGLPDARFGEVVDLAHAFEIPAVVFTGSLDENVRRMVLEKGVVDYVYKKTRTDIDYIPRLVKRILNNRMIQVLVVGDLAVARLFVRRLLEVHQLNVLEATSGEEAVAILKKNRDIPLAIIDYRMPGMDGMETIAAIRAFRSREQLSIIGLSAQSAEGISPLLLKAGANDFLKKPFVNEEFYCRVMQNLEYVEQIQEIRESSLRDYLTGLYNRRFFFDMGQGIYDKAKRKNTGLVLAMVDVDKFKRINDTYGHSIGDAALKHVGKLLVENLRGGDIVARYGGEEFAILAESLDEVTNAFETFDRLRKRIAATPCQTDEGPISLSVSMGVVRNLDAHFEKMIDNADKLLYQAKNQGRNRVLLEEDGSNE